MSGLLCGWKDAGSVEGGSLDEVIVFFVHGSSSGEQERDQIKACAEPVERSPSETARLCLWTDAGVFKPPVDPNRTKPFFCLY